MWEEDPDYRIAYNLIYYKLYNSNEV
jgi:hypothetical protein